MRICRWMWKFSGFKHPTTHKHTAVISPPAAGRPDKPGDESVRCFPVHPVRARKWYFMLSINTYTFLFFFKILFGGESDVVLFQEAERFRVSSDGEGIKLAAVACRKAVMALASSSSSCVAGWIQESLHGWFSNWFTAFMCFELTTVDLVQLQGYFVTITK